MPPEPEKIIYSMSRVSKMHERKPILKDISLSYFLGAKIGVLGANGSGKSTLLRIMAGVDQDFEGRIAPAPGYRIGFLEQEPKLDETLTVRQAVEQGVAAILDLRSRIDAIHEQLAGDITDERMNELLEQAGKLEEQFEAAQGWELEHRVDMAKDALRCPPDEAEVHVLSGGERRRVALCRLLLSNPDILLLDEPTNHLDAESVAWLEQFLQRYPGTVIAVTHDRYFLDNAAGWILELDRGHGIPWKGNYSSWLEQKKARLAVEERAESARQKALQRELEWARRSPQARQRKPRARMAHLEEELSTQYERVGKELEIPIPPGPRLGDMVIELDEVSKGFEDRLLMDRLSCSIAPGSVVGIIGPNGAGKTTLFRMLTGSEKPDSGRVRIGDTVRFAYAEQSRDMLDDSRAVWEVIGDGEELMVVGGVTINTRSYAARFGFTGADQQKKVGVLSGGERNRLHLACVLRSGCNVLLLDEPTNDLDVNTIRALEDGIERFDGVVLVISHDRWFLDRVATHTLAFEGGSEVRFFTGNYTAYEEDRRRRLGEEAMRPHRIRYRKFSRG
ncbi:MAG: energy-dependent translational throttle protein EttA [Phycisphaeraceae bacterium]|nr:energy-dependent translational throttle protein EttA [Phycisphaeraceae bacterium]